MNRLYKWARENGYYLKLANTVHDDLIVEVKKKDLDIIWSKQKEFMTLPYSDDQELPIKTEAEVGYSLQYEVGKYENEERLEIMQKLNTKENKWTRQM
jgi:DNA polymerase I-like protein with 3'-5' exonuclease and polymerase domains